MLILSIGGNRNKKLPKVTRAVLFKLQHLKPEFCYCPGLSHTTIQTMTWLADQTNKGLPGRSMQRNIMVYGLVPGITELGGRILEKDGNSLSSEADGKVQRRPRNDGTGTQQWYTSCKVWGKSQGSHRWGFKLHISEGEPRSLNIGSLCAEGLEKPWAYGTALQAV